MSTLLRDLKYGALLLIKSPGFTLVALLTLALAIGANTAIFSVVRGVLLKPLAYPESDRLVMLYNSYPGVGVDFGSNGVPDYLDRRKETSVFADVTLIDAESFNLGAEGSPERVSGIRVTPSFFPALKTPPALGRAFTEEDATLGNDTKAILTWSLWQRLYGGDPGALGKDLRVNGKPYEIVGVMPEGFRFIDRKAELLTPFAFTDEQKSDDSRHSNFATMIARLAPGVGVARAQAQIDDLNRRNETLFPQYVELLKSVGFHTVVVDLHDEMVKEVRPALVLLLIGVGTVLLIGCVNVANLLLVRANGRMRELAIRLAMGAGRRRLARQLLTESVLLGVIGGAIGLGVGAAAVRLFARIGLDQLPRGGEVHVDATVAAFALALAVGTGLLFGLLPVVKVLRADLNDVFRQSGRTGSSGRAAGLTRSGLVVLQVSLAFVLLIAAGLTLASFQKALAVDPGFDLHRVVTARLTLPKSRYPEDADARSLLTRVLAGIRAQPGIARAGATNFLPFGGDANASVISVEGHTLAPGEKPPVPHYASVDDQYLGVLGIPLLRGRTFDPAGRRRDRPGGGHRPRARRTLLARRGSHRPAPPSGLAGKEQRQPLVHRRRHRRQHQDDRADRTRHGGHRLLQRLPAPHPEPLAGRSRPPCPRTRSWPPCGARCCAPTPSCRSSTSRAWRRASTSRWPTAGRRWCCWPCSRRWRCCWRRSGSTASSPTRCASAPARSAFGWRWGRSASRSFARSSGRGHGSSAWAWPWASPAPSPPPGRWRASSTGSDPPTRGCSARWRRR